MWLFLLYTERCWVSPGLADDRHPDRYLFSAGHAVVRRRDSSLDQPRAKSDQRERIGSARRTTKVPWHQVSQLHSRTYRQHSMQGRGDFFLVTYIGLVLYRAVE